MIYLGIILALFALIFGVLGASSVFSWISLACVALSACVCGYMVFAANKDKDVKELALAYTSNEEFWGENLDKIEGFTSAVIENIELINSIGAREALKKVL